MSRKNEDAIDYSGSKVSRKSLKNWKHKARSLRDFSSLSGLKALSAGFFRKSKANFT